jgi:hypothetical protein
LADCAKAKERPVLDNLSTAQFRDMAISVFFLTAFFTLLLYLMGVLKIVIHIPGLSPN